MQQAELSFGSCKSFLVLYGVQAVSGRVNSALQQPHSVCINARRTVRSILQHDAPERSSSVSSSTL